MRPATYKASSRAETNLRKEANHEPQ
jgi:hypothetical protein